MGDLYEWQLDESWLGLRFLTRLRYHLVQDLTREKNYYQAYLFVLNSAYAQQKPFSDLFGVTSSKILADLGQVEAFSQLDKYALADNLQKMSGNGLKDPLKNARKLKAVAAEYFQIDPGLAQTLQEMLNLVLEHIRFIQDQINTVNQLMAIEAKSHPEVALLRTIPGIGLVFSCGIAAELGDINRFLKDQKYDRKKKRYRPKNLRDADASIAKIAGLWWPRSASGGFEAEERKLSKTGNRYLRYYLIEAADRLRQWEPHYQAHYQKKHAESKKFAHKRALVLTARKSIRLYVGLLHRKEPFRSKESLKNID
jgi:transposase